MDHTASIISTRSGHATLPERTPSTALVYGEALEDGFATSVANLQAEYRTLNSSIENMTTELLAEHRKVMDRFDDELLAEVVK